MVTRINHDLRSNDGKTIVMPSWADGEAGWGNLALPNVYEADTSQKYPCGTKFQDGERTFRYARFKGTMNGAAQNVVVEEAVSDTMCGKGLAAQAFAQDYAATYVTGLVGENKVYIHTTVAATAAGVERADNYYSGGWLSIYDSGAGGTYRYQFRKIVKSEYDAAKTVAGTARTHVTTLTLDQPLTIGITASAICQVMPNKWKHAVWNTTTAYAVYSPILGACQVCVPVYGQWLWLQTWGEMGTCHISTAFGGVSTNEQRMYWRSDGSMDPMQNGNTDTLGLQAHQLAGYAMANTASESGSGQDESYPIVFLTMWN